MEVTVTISEGDRTLSVSQCGILSINQLLAAYRDAALAAGFAIGEVAADNDLGDVFWSDEE